MCLLLKVKHLVLSISLEVFISLIIALLPSLSMEIPNTTMSGPQAVNGPRGLIAGMDCRIAMAKKYILAILSNCLSRDSS
jgi:hypothetical protein